MIKFEEVWSKVKDDVPLAVFDNAYSDTASSKLVTIPRHRDYQRDSTHPKWYGTDMNYYK